MKELKDGHQDRLHNEGKTRRGSLQLMHPLATNMPEMKPGPQPFRQGAPTPRQLSDKFVLFQRTPVNKKTWYSSVTPAGNLNASASSAFNRIEFKANKLATLKTSSGLASLISRLNHQDSDKESSSDSSGNSSGNSVECDQSRRLKGKAVCAASVPCDEVEDDLEESNRAYFKSDKPQRPAAPKRKHMFTEEIMFDDD